MTAYIYDDFYWTVVENSMLRGDATASAFLFSQKDEMRYKLGEDGRFDATEVALAITEVRKEIQKHLSHHIQLVVHEGLDLKTNQSILVTFKLPIGDTIFKYQQEFSIIRLSLVRNLELQMRLVVEKYAKEVGKLLVLGGED